MQPEKIIEYWGTFSVDELNAIPRFGLEGAISTSIARIAHLEAELDEAKSCISNEMTAGHDAYDKGVVAETERCAKILDTERNSYKDNGRDWPSKLELILSDLAAAIRKETA